MIHLAASRLASLLSSHFIAPRPSPFHRRPLAFQGTHLPSPRLRTPWLCADVQGLVLSSLSPPCLVSRVQLVLLKRSGVHRFPSRSSLYHSSLPPASSLFSFIFLSSLEMRLSRIRFRRTLRVTIYLTGPTTYFSARCITFVFVSRLVLTGFGSGSSNEDSLAFVFFSLKFSVHPQVSLLPSKARSLLSSLRRLRLALFFSPSPGPSLTSSRTL